MIEIGGAGRHLLTLQLPTIQTGLKLSVALQIICPLASSLSKLGVLALFHTIFGRTSHRYRLITRVTSALVVVVLLFQLIVPFANCRPFSYNWNRQQKGTCTIEPLLLWRYLSIPNVLTTTIVVGIPMPALYRLKVSTATKVGLGVVFTVCVAGIIAAIMRFRAFHQVQDFNDITYEEIEPLCWTIAESGIYMIAGVMPTLRPLVRKVWGDSVFDRILSGNSRSSKTMGNRRWSRMVLRGENTRPLKLKEDNMSLDVGSQGTLVGTQVKEKERVLKKDCVPVQI
jgi:hypothetical protein